MSCITLPPAPPPGPPAPPPAPVPPPPAPAPGDPPAVPPSAPPGTPHVALDIASTYFQPTPFCFGGKYIPQINADGGVSADFGGVLSLVTQNVSGTAAGTINVRVSADNTAVAVRNCNGCYTGPLADVVTINVPAGNTVITDFTIDASGVDPGLIVVTIDNGSGTFKFNLITIGTFDCSGGGG